MIAGLLTEMLEWYLPSTVTNDYGSEQVQWKLKGTIRAELVKRSGRLSNEAGELFSDYSAEFRVRYGHGIKEGDRVRHLDSGVLYYVTNVMPHRRRGFRLIQVEKVNE